MIDQESVSVILHLERNSSVSVQIRIQGDIVDTIKNKLSKKRYEENTILACLILKGGEYNIDNTIKSVSDVVINLSAIFLIYHEDSGNTINVIQIAPKVNELKINIAEDVKYFIENKLPAYFIFEKRGRGGIKEISIDTPPKLFNN